MGDNSKKPGIRFKGFTDDWEQRKLGELGTITTGNTPSTSIPDYYSDDGIVWVTPTDICENITFESARKLSDLGQQVGRVVPKNTILVTCIASIGKNTMLGNTGSFNQQINGLTPNENKYDPYFLLTESALWSAKMKGSAAAGTMQIVNRTEFSELKTWLPSLIEQQAIGAFFKQLDHLITLHQRKYDKLVMSKKSMLEKMFPKNGQTKPEIRFSGFIDDWEQRKLGELGTITTGNTPSTSIPDYYSDDGIVWVTPTDICENITFESARKLSDLGQQVGRVVPKNTILVTCIASIGKNTMLGNTGSFNQQINGLTPNENKYDPYFLLTESALWSAKMKGSAAAGTMQIVNRTEFSELKTWLPSLIEQQAIGAFFKQLDHLITLHQRKYDKLVMSKKSMLEKMFPKNGQTKPEIRFSGFIDDWEQRKLGELGSLKNGMNFSKKAMGIGFPFVNLQNIFGNNVIDVSNLGKAMASDSQLKDYNLLNGDVLFVRSSVKLEGVGEAALVPQTLDNTTYSGFIIRFRDEYGLDNNFKRFVFGIESVRNQIMSQATNSANKNISQSVLENLELAIPSKSEQQKIGAYFSNLDHLITLHQRELEKLKKIKLSMLEKMFV